MIQNTSRPLICEMLDKNSVLNCREMYVMLKLGVWGGLGSMLFYFDYNISFILDSCLRGLLYPNAVNA